MPAASPSDAATARELVREAVERLQSFPHFFPVVNKALALIEQEQTTNQELQQVLSADQAAVGQLLRLANSAYFGFSSEVRTLSLAIQIIGYSRIKLLLRYILLAGLFEQLSTGRPGAKRIRETSIGAAAAARELAAESQTGDPEELSIAGLLHNAGELALSWLFPQQYDVVLKLGESVSLATAQEDVFGVRAATVGRWVLESWKFPVFFADAVEYWENPLDPRLDASLTRPLCVIHAGVRIAEGWQRHIAGQAVEIDPEIIGRIGLPEQAIDRVRAALPAAVSQIRSVIRS